MVLVAWSEVYRSGQPEIVDAISGYFWNLCGSLYSKVDASPFVFYFYLYLSAPNYAPVTLLPDTSIESDFKLEGAYFLNEGYGSEHSKYVVRLGQRYALFVVYKVEISRKNALLTHHNRLAQIFAPPPASVLL